MLEPKVEWISLESKLVSVTETTNHHHQQILGSTEVLKPAYSTSSLSLAQTYW